MRVLILLALAALIAAPARAQWELLPTPRRTYNNAPLPAEAFTTFDGVVLASFDTYDATDGCGSCHATFASRDAGQTWALVRDPAGALFTMASFDRRGGALYGVHNYPVSSASNGRVYRSTDGLAWTLAAPATGAGSLGSVQVTADGALWTQRPNSGSNPAAVMRSQAGSPWADVTGAIDTQYGVRPATATDSRVFATTLYKLYARDAAGGTWAVVPYFADAGPRAMDDDGQTLYAAATVVRSLPAPPYVRFEYVHRSDDGGTTWAVVAGFPADRQASGVWTGTNGTVVATLERTGSDPRYPLAVSRDRGASWTLVDPPQAGEYAEQARVEGAYLYALSGGDKRLYRYPLAGLPTAADAAPEVPGLDLRVGPNPAATTTTLRFALAEAQTARVTLTDVLGREVLALDRALGAGPQTLPLDVSGLAPGVYVARVTTFGASASVRFTITR